MNADEYKFLTARPDVFSRGELAETLGVVAGALADEVRPFLEGTPVEKPPLHKGGAESDYFAVRLDSDVVDEIVNELLGAESAAVSPEGFTTREASRLASLVDRWNRYLEWLGGGVT